MRLQKQLQKHRLAIQNEHVNLHQLKQDLLKIKTDTLLGLAANIGVKENFSACLRMIREQYMDNPTLVESVFGENLIKRILSV